MASDTPTAKTNLATIPLEWGDGQKSDEGDGPTSGSVIELTESARAEVLRLMVEEGKPGLRLGIKGGGCSGLSYLLEFTEEREGDTIVEFDGFRVFVDPKSYVYVDGCEIDYKHEGLNEGFEFYNPKEKARCGCGESFTI